MPFTDALTCKSRVQVKGGKEYVANRRDGFDGKKEVSGHAMNLQKDELATGELVGRNAENRLHL